MQLDTLETPALILDRSKMSANISRLARKLSGFDVALRPHVKTAKSLPVVEAMRPNPDGGITVSTLKEAEHFFDAGITDILYAVAMTPAKLARVADLLRRGCAIKIILDSVQSARTVVEEGSAHGVAFDVLIEIDCDGHRAGLRPGDPGIVGVGRTLHESPGAHLAGVMTHAGGSYESETTDEIVRAAEQERRAVVDGAEQLRGAGLPCPIVSVGSTPTVLVVERLDGVTEVRPGTYVFQDLVMAGLGVCRPEEIALSVLGCVIGHRPDKSWVIVDAGWMSMSRDRGTARQAVDQGYGLVADLEGEIFGDLVLEGVNQEHGIIAHRHGGPIDPARFPLGSYVRVLPNHGCATAAQHDRYLVVDGSTEVVETWDRFSGW